MQKNTRRVSHNIDKDPNIFRDDQLERIINDVNELISGKGFCEISYISSTPFVDTMDVYEDNTKTKLRADVAYTYVGGNPPFVSTIVTNIYDDTTGTVIVSTVTQTVGYNSNNSVRDIDTVVTRP